MLQDMGIPVEAERGPYGAYQLQRGYKLPPLMFTDAEAIALTLGLVVMRAFRFPVDVAAVEGALAKTERVLPEKLLHQVRGLREAIWFNVSPPPTFLQDGLVTTLSAATQQRQQVFLRYQSFGGEISERAFDPYGIVFNEGYWYTAGYCHLREDLRTFRLDRIVALEPLAESFERPDEFDVLDHVIKSLATGPGTEQVEVLLETTMEHARQLIDPVFGTLEPVENGVLLRRAPYQLEWVAHMLLNFDFPVRVLQPDALRDLIRQMTMRGLQILGDDAEQLMNVEI
jgi:predicted DNA-binding transcriptional regulator YafY